MFVLLFMATPVTSRPKRSRDQVSPLQQDSNKSLKMLPEAVSVVPLDQYELGEDAPQWAKLMFALIVANHQELSRKLDITRQAEIAPLKEKNKILEARVQELENSNRSLREQNLRQETYSRRNNLLIHGLPEPAWETQGQCEKITRDFFVRLGLDGVNMKLERVHRKGPRSHTDRSVIVRFYEWTDREAVWKKRPGQQPPTNSQNRENPESNSSNASNVQQVNQSNPSTSTITTTETPPRSHNTTHIRISQDFPLEIAARRRRFIPVLKLAKTIPEYKNTYLRDDKLTVNGVTFTTETMHLLPPALDPRFIATQKKESYIAFWGINSPLSNHHPAKFWVNNTVYNCVEQRYMHSMAIHAGDRVKAHQIMMSDDPVVQKRTTRGIPLTNEWKKQRNTVMAEALRAKFKQIPDLRDFLLNTKDQELVEASPTDAYWGCGLGMNSPLLPFKENWTGHNMLGTLLCDIRAEIISETQH